MYRCRFYFYKIKQKFKICFQEPEPEKEQTPLPEYRKSGLPHRKTRLPKRYQDVLPPRPPVIPAPVLEIPDPSQHEDELPAAPQFKTDPNSFGVYRIYKSGEPSFNPDDNFRVTNVADGPNFTKDKRSDPQPTFTQSDLSDDTEPMPTRPHYLPFQNMSTFRLMQWFYDSSLMKYLGTLNNLVHQVLLAPDFNTTDLTGFDAAKEAKCLDNFDPSAKEECSSGSGSKQLNDG